MLVESFLIEKLQGGGSNSKTNSKALILAILNIILAILAGYLCWNCNANHGTLVRVIFTIIAAVFSGLYILYYFVAHVLMRIPCGSGGGGGSGSGSGKGSSGSSGSSSGSSGSTRTFNDTIFD